MRNIVITDDSRNTVLFVHVVMLDQVQYMGIPYIVYFQKQFLHCMYIVHKHPGFLLLSIAIHCL